MAGKSPVTGDEEQRSALIALSRSRDRGEADRARAILLTLSGWTRGQIAEAFGVREDTVRFWRSAFTAGGIEALKTSIAPGSAPVKAERALAVAEEVLFRPVGEAARSDIYIHGVEAISVQPPQARVVSLALCPSTPHSDLNAMLKVCQF